MPCVAEDGSLFSASSVANSALDMFAPAGGRLPPNRQCLTTAVPGHKIVPIAGRTPPVSWRHFAFGDPVAPIKSTAA
ncbi:hypothetical protein KCP76_03540 [Salmonella enterica subsp. enterica serovar Weltevreden]|nr:hypothetical protein KCP76_03540 [Salmonella enterica subsp. enterica serovar Weltevreden]